MSLAKHLWPAALLLSFTVQATPQYFTVDKETLSLVRKEMRGVGTLKTENGISIIKVDQRLNDFITENIRTQKHGGFMAHNTYADALEALKPSPEIFPFTGFAITEQERVVPMVDQIQEPELLKTIIKLSSYMTRFHKNALGKQSQEWIKNNWAEITKGRNDVSIELINHVSTPQPSVILTIKGSTNPDEIVVIGGHGDSIASSWGGGDKKAPGADDNASGLACVTEVLRVLIENSYKPNRTIKFISYAGEEGGLLGSNEVANAYKKANARVIGVMQLDMTNYKGSAKEIYMMSDNTNTELNNFVGNLIDTYIKVSWGYDKCGYGCSDHASWTKNGYPSTIPFESMASQYNPKIHSSDDTLDVTNGHADHSVPFAKLGLAFLVEMAK